MSTTTDKMRDWLLESLMLDDEYPNDGVPKQIQRITNSKANLQNYLKTIKLNILEIEVGFHKVMVLLKELFKL